MKKIALVMIFFSLSGFARGMSEDMYKLDVGGGIAAPAYNTAVFRNAAGLIYNQSVKLNVSSYWVDRSQLGQPTVGADMIFGNGFYGVDIGGFYDVNSETMGLQYGGAFYIPAMEFALGVSGRSVFSSNFNDLDLGMMFLPHGVFNIGVTAYSLVSGVDALGFGLGFNLGQHVKLTLDTTTNMDFDQIALKPAFLIGKGMFGFTVGYAVSIVGSTILAMNQGPSVGLSLVPTHAFTWGIYWDQLSNLATNFSFRF